jgi:hypothetical protein
MSDRRIRATRHRLTPRPTLGSVKLAEFTLDGRPVTKSPDRRHDRLLLAHRHGPSHCAAEPCNEFGLSHQVFKTGA